MKINVYDPAEPITAPGVYEMTEEQYHADPCAKPSLSASLIKVGLPGGRSGGSPLHMQWVHPKLSPKPPEQEASRKFDMGSAFHALILGCGAELVIVDAADWRTKDAKEQRNAAYAAGQQPVLRSQFDKAQMMVKAARWQMPRWQELAYAMAGGAPERVLIWQEQTRSGPIMCRAKLDWVPHSGEAFPDWKTTEASAAPDAYGRIMFDTGADVQDAFYRRGIKAVLDREAYLIFPAIETAEPHAMMVHRIDKSSAAMAERKVKWGIETFAMCLKAGIWPGYPGDVAWQSAPPWHETQWIDREDAGLTGNDFTAQMIERLKDMGKSGQTFDPEFAADFNLEAKGE